MTAPVVLLVDDEPSLRTLMRMYLEEEGYRVEEVGDGVQALVRLRASAEPLIVVMNTRMPRMNATALLQTVAHEVALQRHGYVLATALATMLPDDLWELTQRLKVPVVAKPFTMQQLLAGVAAAEHHLAQTASCSPPDRADVSSVACSPFCSDGRQPLDDSYRSGDRGRVTR